VRIKARFRKYFKRLPCTFAATQTDLRTLAWAGETSDGQRPNFACRPTDLTLASLTLPSGIIGKHLMRDNSERPSVTDSKSDAALGTSGDLLTGREIRS
jgi:hypothetical protein